jgi:hypothetical protein
VNWLAVAIGVAGIAIIRTIISCSLSPEMEDAQPNERKKDKEEEDSS